MLRREELSRKQREQVGTILGKTFKYTYIRARRSASGSSASLSLHQLQRKALWSPRNLVPDWRVTAWG